LKAACTLDRTAALAEADDAEGGPPVDGGLVVDDGGFISLLLFDSIHGPADLQNSQPACM